MYSKTWAHGVVSEYMERHARVTDLLLKKWDLYPVVLVDFLSKNQPEWEGFKFIVKHLENWTYTDLSTEFLSILRQFFVHVSTNIDPGRLLTGLFFWSKLNSHSGEARRASLGETGPAIAGLSRREAAERAATILVASDVLGVDEARCL